MDEPDPAMPGEPPDDPEEWTDEQWLAWLVATDDGHEPPPARPDRVDRAVSSAVGYVMGQAMLGMANAIYGHDDPEVVVVVEGTGEPGDDEPFTVHLDAEHPEDSYVVFHEPPPGDAP